MKDIYFYKIRPMKLISDLIEKYNNYIEQLHSTIYIIEISIAQFDYLQDYYIYYGKKTENEKEELELKFKIYYNKRKYYMLHKKVDNIKKLILYLRNLYELDLIHSL